MQAQVPLSHGTHENGGEPTQPTVMEAETPEKISYLLFVHKCSMKLRRRVGFVFRNFAYDLAVEETYKYPILGLFKFSISPSLWFYSVILAFSYFCIFVMVAALYYLFILPILLTWAVAAMGPIGFIIVHIQWLLQSNAIAVALTKILIFPVFFASLFDTVLFKLGNEQFLREAKYLPQITSKKISKTSPEFWFGVFPLKVISASFHFLVKVFFMVLSLIPIIGPTAVNQLMSPKRGYAYADRYFKLRKNTAEEKNDAFYEHLGKFTAFGMMAGALELVPLVSLITIPSNIVGGAMWVSDEIQKIT
ncbi:LAMI_0F06700g1_1 [Lachancea mirantina]|uniref:LAMI_0F06700g1_1 n=1 Tax=Lachancea mirantina TaxID=1230905 RepID=A0A1G4JZ32_9SACH|nr:LAMI_0F06700g1_1 [Lachancea mirantina]